jgi:hypothetical protein
MLQQAFAFALAAEHQILVIDSIPESEAAPEADLAIVDAAALRDGGSAAMRQLNAIRSWQIPVIWFGTESPAVEWAQRKFVRLAPPLDRESLKKVVADILGSSSQGPSPAATPKPKQVTAAASEQPKPKEVPASSLASENKKKVIELLEVVEEQPAHDMIKTEAGKKS